MSIQGFATIAAFGIGLVLSVGILAYEIYNTRSRYHNYHHASNNSFTYPGSTTSTSSSNNRPISPSKRRRKPVNDAKTCVVCLENFTDDKTALKTLLCGHCFHCTCIDTWFAVSSSCPVCRANSTI